MILPLIKSRLKELLKGAERGIIIPTFEQMRNPGLIPESIKEELKNIGLWGVHPKNLFRISWKNEPISHGGRDLMV